MSIWVGTAIQSDIYEAGGGNCGKTVQKVTTGVTVLGTIMITASLALVICDATCCGRCPGNKCASGYEDDLDDAKIWFYYTIVLFFLSIVLLVLGALLHNYVKKNDNACAKIKSKSNYLLWTGIIGVVVTAGPTVFSMVKLFSDKAHKRYKDNKASHEAQEEARAEHRAEAAKEKAAEKAKKAAKAAKAKEAAKAAKKEAAEKEAARHAKVKSEEAARLKKEQRAMKKRALGKQESPRRNRRGHAKRSSA